MTVHRSREHNAASEKQAAPQVAQELACFPSIETHFIQSQHVAQSFRIQVMCPAGKRSDTRQYPVLYCTDGNFNFDVLKGIAYGLQNSARDAPAFMVVGIGYPGDSPLAGSVLRARDLTFPSYPQLSTEPPCVEGVLVAEAGTRNFHGAEDFQKFIECELIPFIDARYRTSAGARTYFGHSAGGGFGLYTLFTRPELFRNYIISSPGLIYHGQSSAGVRYEDYDFMLQEARAFISSAKRLDGVHVYMSVGAEEEFEPNLSQWRLTSSFHRMAALLNSAAIPGLRLTTEVFPGETHMTVWPMAYIHGVQAVFGTRLPGRDKSPGSEHAT